MFEPVSAASAVTSAAVIAPTTAAEPATEPEYFTPKRPKPENVTSAAATDAVATSAVVAKTRPYSYKEPQSMSAYNDSLAIVWLSSTCSSDNTV